MTEYSITSKALSIQPRNAASKVLRCAIVLSRQRKASDTLFATVAGELIQPHRMALSGAESAADYRTFEQNGPLTAILAAK